MSSGNVWEEVGANDTARVVREVPQQATVLVVAGLDPSGGAGLLADARVVTPNLDELSQLTARHIDDPDAMKDGARRLRARGPRAVLVKGGHLHGDPIDVLVDKDGDLSIKGARIEGPTPHGTGCALSTEIACRLAISTPLREAVLASCERVRQRIAEARTVG